MARMAEAEKHTILTPEGLRKLEDELDHLKTVKRKEIAERIKASKEFGDISENAEYEDAKNDQAFIEGRILQLDQMLRNARAAHGRGRRGHRARGQDEVQRAEDHPLDARRLFRPTSGKKPR